MSRVELKTDRGVARGLRINLAQGSFWLYPHHWMLLSLGRRLIG